MNNLMVQQVMCLHIHKICTGFSLQTTKEDYFGHPSLAVDATSLHIWSGYPSGEWINTDPQQGKD